jgi:hypothetical protein
MTTSTTTDNSAMLMTPLFWRIMDDLYKRGVRALLSPREGEFLFSRDASLVPTVAMAPLASSSRLRAKARSRRSRAAPYALVTILTWTPDASARWRISRSAAPWAVEDLISGSEDEDEEPVDKPQLIDSDGETYGNLPTNQAEARKRIESIWICEPRRIQASTARTCSD